MYIWKDDLRERIRIAMENATSEDDFLEALEDEGVKARYGTSRQHDKYISYELVDVPDHMEGADRKYKARSYTLGDAYGVKALPPLNVSVCGAVALCVGCFASGILFSPSVLSAGREKG